MNKTKKSSENMVEPQRIDMRLHEVEHVYYDPRADFLAGVALDAECVSSEKTERRLLREADRIIDTARVTCTHGTRSVRRSLVEALRKLGG